MFNIVLVGGILDILLFMYLKSKVDFNYSIGVNEIEKGAEFKLIINVKNNSLIPSSKINILIEHNDRIKVDKEYFSILLDGGEEVILSIKCIGEYRGNGVLKISKTSFHSYLGILNYDLSHGFNYLENNISIIPQIKELTNGEALYTDNLKSMENYTSISENIILGDASYDFKVYSDGEPLSMINWKLSSKVGKLMIRERERLFKPSYRIILNPTRAESNLILEDLIVEGCLSLIKDMYINDYNVIAEIYTNNTWHSYTVDKENIITEIQRTLSEFEFTEKNIPLNHNVNDEVYIFSLNNNFNYYNGNVILPCINKPLVHLKEIWYLYTNMEIERS
ncbi:MAG: DUF58 domain-containing protein [Clostridium sp.]